MHCNNPWMWFSSLFLRCAGWFNKCRALGTKRVVQKKKSKQLPETKQTAVCEYGQYIQRFPTEHYIISQANLCWREQQIALEQSPNPRSNTQTPYQGLHLVPIVFFLCHELKHHPGQLLVPLSLGNSKSGLKHFTWAPSLKKTAEEEQSEMSFQGWKKAVSVYLMSFQRSVCHMCRRLRQAQ